MTDLFARYIRTAALSQAVQDYLDGKGIGFALAEDSARAMLLLASDEKINGVLNFILLCGAMLIWFRQVVRWESSPGNRISLESLILTWTTTRLETCTMTGRRLCWIPREFWW